MYMKVCLIIFLVRKTSLCNHFLIIFYILVGKHLQCSIKFHNPHIPPWSRLVLWCRCLSVMYRNETGCDDRLWWKDAWTATVALCTSKTNSKGLSHTSCSHSYKLWCTMSYILNIFWTDLRNNFFVLSVQKSSPQWIPNLKYLRSHEWGLVATTKLGSYKRC